MLRQDIQYFYPVLDPRAVVCAGSGFLDPLLLPCEDGRFVKNFHSLVLGE